MRGALDGTVFTARETCTETFFKRYRMACAFVVADVGDVINAMVRLKPELKPSDEGWVRVAVQRRDAAPPPAGLRGQALVRAEVDIVAAHLEDIRQSDDAGILEAVFEDIDEHLSVVMDVLKDWEPRT